MTRSLWIMRHGLAVNEFDSDFNRALSEQGKIQVDNVATQIVNQFERPERMLVSPFRRTQETAKIVHQTLQLTQAFETEDMLVHFGDAKLLGNYLLSIDFDKVILISHMPIVASLCRYLVADCDIFGFQTAQAVKLEFCEKNIGKVCNLYLPE